jgi:hypothetical protein
MVNFPGRDRRRRVLKDEVLSASSNHSALRATADADAVGDAMRYSDAASVENHPQITDFVPRRYRTIAMLVMVGTGLTTTLAALHFFAPRIAISTGLHDTAALDFAATGSLAAWFSAVVLLMASGTCLLVYSIRRHRIDDFRGRYRVWFGATLACLAVSANSVTGLHQIAADMLGHLTGWTALRGGAVWWLVLAGLPIGWIVARAILDVRECRLAAVLLIAGVVSYTASAAGFLGLTPFRDRQMQSLVVGSALLLGHWLVLASVVSYARFVILDAQGLIAIRRRANSNRSAKAEPPKQAAAQTSSAVSKAASSADSASGTLRQAVQASKTPADTSRWVDGSRPQRDRYERDGDDDESSGGDRKLSKTDRKRLRKLKAQGRAA